MDTIIFSFCQGIVTVTQGNVKVDSNLVKPVEFALPITGLKSEIPGPDLAYQDAVLENQAMTSNGSKRILESSRARAGRIPRPCRGTISKFEYPPAMQPDQGQSNNRGVPLTLSACHE